MRIGIDIMGGDYAPQAIVEGAILAQQEIDASIRLVLIGDAEKAREIIASHNIDTALFDFVPTTEVIEMGEHPAKAFAQKPNSSIAVGFGMLAKQKIDGFASAGNTGAMLAGTMFTVKQIQGIHRPCIAAGIPQINGKTALLLDVGLNADCKPDILYQFAMLGSIYASEVYKIENPRISLLNIGSEKEKGNILMKATHELMNGTTDFNFVGNAEGSDLFDGDKADVFVCDGFVGNIVLKEAEALYKLIRKQGIKNDFFERFNFENFGGTPILGVNAPVIIAHGVSNAKAIKNMILQVRDVVAAELPKKVSGSLSQYFEKNK